MTFPAYFSHDVCYSTLKKTAPEHVKKNKFSLERVFKMFKIIWQRLVPNLLVSEKRMENVQDVINCLKLLTEDYPQ